MTSRPLLSSLRNVLFAREQRFDPSLRGSVYAVSTAPAAVAARTPSHAERCRTLFARARHGVLSTLAREPKGFPFGSLVAVACDEDGQPLLLLSALAEHTQNLEVAADASLLVVGDTTHFPGVGASREAYAGLLQRRQQHLIQQLVLLGDQVAGLGRHQRVHLGRSAAVRAGIAHLEFDLFLEPGDPDLEKLVQIAGDDAKEAQPFQ